MQERDNEEALNQLDISGFQADLVTLSNNDLRKAYPREANSHRNRKADAKAHGWDFDPAWSKFRDFLRDMGPVPGDGYTLDRIDSKVERYGPGLCRWATKAEQTRNRSNTRFVALGEEQLTIAELAHRTGKPYKTVHSALARGVTAGDLIKRASFGHSGSRYCPLRYQDDIIGLEKWYNNFEKWKRLVRKDVRAEYGRPEIYDFAKVAALYPISRRWLETKGYFELTPYDGDEADRLASTDEGRIYIHGVAWMDFALSCLEHEDPRLAASLSKRPDRYRNAAGLDEWLCRNTDRLASRG